MIIFPHFMKTGGTSIRTDIEKGAAGRYLLDYIWGQNLSRRSINRFRIYLSKQQVKFNYKKLINNYDIIYGHFVADKYIYLNKFADIKLISFFRDPVERSISYYCYMMERFKNNAANIKEYWSFPILKPLAQGKATLKDLVYSDEMIHYYKDSLGSIEIQNMAFTGISERYEQSIEIINNLFCTKFSANIRENTTSRSAYASQIKDYYHHVVKANEENYYYYNQALGKFNKMKLELSKKIFLPIV